MPQLPPTNQVILTGELTEEPSVHYLAPDFPEVRLRLKTEEEVTGREGGRPYLQRLYHRVIARGQAGIALEHLHTAPAPDHQGGVKPTTPYFNAQRYKPAEDEDPLS